ncbi:MAG: hypothetical protein AABW73_02595 [Nanoarchaeota archaeon]
MRTIYQLLPFKKVACLEVFQELRMAQGQELSEEDKSITGRTSYYCKIVSNDGEYSNAPPVANRTIESLAEGVMQELSKNHESFAEYAVIIVNDPPKLQSLIDSHCEPMSVTRKISPGERIRMQRRISELIVARA